MNIHLKTALRILMIVSILHLINSCQDPDYDLNKSINTEISIGGDSLTIPIGSTDTILLKDFLSTDDLEFLEIMEDGGYGLKIADSLIINDLLKDLDKSSLQFEDYIFSENASISFGDISLDEFKIPGFNKRDTLQLNIPKVEISDIVPAFSMSEQFSMSFSNYSLQEEDLTLSDFDRNTGKNNFLADLIPYDIPFNPAIEFSSPTPIQITDEDGNPLSVTVNYSIEVPDGITNIYQIDLESGGVMDISMEMTDAISSLSNGTFTPDITIDPTNMFGFNPLTPLSSGKIKLGASEVLKHSNSYKSSKQYLISSFKNLPTAINNIIDIERIISIQGTMDAEGTLRENKAMDAKEIDLVIMVTIKGLKIKNMDFDIPTFTTSLSGSSNFEINETNLPEQVNKINKIAFVKDPSSSLNTNMELHFMPSNLPEMISSNYTIDQMNITFPQGFAFSNMAGRTYSATNVSFNTTTGYKVGLNLSEIDLSSVPINNGTLNWSGEISYSGQVSVNGRMHSENINPNTDPVIDLTSQTAIKLKNATVVTNLIEEEMEPSELDIQLDIDIAEQVARLTTINMKRGSMIRVNINQPTLPLDITANNLQIQFSDLFEFYPTTGLSENKFTINGTIPEFIELELKALHINKELDNGRLVLNENIYISGGVQLASAVVNSDDIADLSDKEITIQAIVSDLFIESTSIELNTLEANYEGSTVLDMNISDIPTEIVALDSIILNANSSIELEISITNLPNLGTNPLTASINVTFPELLQFAPGHVSANNELIINEPFVDGKLNKVISLRSLKFDGANLGGKIAIDDMVNYSVGVRVENPTLNSDDLKDDPIEVEVKVSLKDLAFQQVYGKFDVDFDDQLNIGSIALDLPEVLKGDDVVLDISNPVLTLSTESNIGIPVDAELALLKYIGGQLQTNNKIAVNFSLPKSNSPLDIITTNYWVAPSEDGKPADYTYLATNLQDLLNPIPDSVKIEINPSIDTDQQHLIDLQAIYSLKVKYGINVPFSFGKDFSITVRDTIDNVDLGMDENELKTGSLELLGTIENSIPLNLELQLWLTDANYNILATSSNQLIKAGAPDGSGVVSQLSVKIADNLEELGKLNKVILTFKATSNTTVAGTAIKPENYIKADLRARVGGIKVTL